MNKGMIKHITGWVFILMGIVLINASLLTVGTLIAIVQASNLIINPIVNYINSTIVE